MESICTPTNVLWVFGFHVMRMFWLIRKACIDMGHITQRLVNAKHGISSHSASPNYFRPVFFFLRRAIC